jgi:hypothetical protein
MDSVPRKVVLELCQKYGAELRAPAHLNGVMLMAAFAQNESSFGDDTAARYEHSYDRGGSYDRAEQAGLLDKFGRAAAFSYGPWQTLPCNALAFAPSELNENPDAAARAFVADFNRRVMPHAPTIYFMGQMYNGGHVSNNPLPGVHAYALELQRNYAMWASKLRHEGNDAPAIA